jgi:hypothetical protein
MSRAPRPLTALFCSGPFAVPLTACGGARLGGIGTPPAGSPPATRAPKAKPTRAATIPVAFGQSLLAVAEANSIMQPLTAASAIRVDTRPIGGSCHDQDAQFKVVVSINFLLLPSRSGALSALASQITAVAGAHVTTPSVSGIGDQTLFVAATLTTVHRRQEDLDVVDGGLVMQCFNPDVGSASDPSQQAVLTKVCQQVSNRLQAFPQAQIELWAVDKRPIGFRLPQADPATGWRFDGQRPTALVQHRYTWRYLVAFVHLTSGRLRCRA